MFAQQPIDRIAIPDADLRGSWLGKATAHRNLGVDASPAGNNGTPAGKPTALPVGVRCDGIDDAIDFGDIGNVQQVSMWVNPGSATEQLFLVDAGNYVHLVAGTVTYVGLTAVATYVNSVAGTTLAANQWQFLVCVFSQIDANNFELAVDGAGNFGDIDVKDLRALDAVWSANRIAYEYGLAIPDADLVLWTFGGVTDLTRFVRTPTHLGGVVVGHDMFFDGTDDKIDWGDLGNVQAVSLWLDPETTTEEILLVDTGNDIMVNVGTVTYTGLTPVATYVNGVAGTTMVADKWQHLLCVFSQIDANNFELGWDGANYGNTRQRDLRVYNRIPSADEARLLYETHRRAF